MTYTTEEGKRSRTRGIIPQPIANVFRKIYNPLGFKKGYNFFLFFFTCGALMGFILARFQYLAIDSIFLKSTSPGDAIHYTRPGYKRVGIIIHLAGILPAGFLVVFQFIPVIRHKLLLVHRINGYVVSLLLLVSLAGAFMVLDSSAGGYIATQVGIAVLGAVTTISLGLAYYNIKRLRIHLHREWMIRTWVYAASIISLRLIQLAAQEVMRRRSDYDWSAVMTCSDIFQQYALFIPPGFPNPTPLIYPACTQPSLTMVVVKAFGQGPENASAMFNLTFGPSLWLALTIHAICVEVYFRLTKAEDERLRQVSEERRIEAGYMKRPSREPGSSSFSQNKPTESDSEPN